MAGNRAARCCCLSGSWVRLALPLLLVAAATALHGPPTSRRRAVVAFGGDECLSIKFVTGNAMKLREVEAILSQNGLPLPLEQCDLDLDEYQGVAEDIAAAKCRLAAEATGGAAMIDDTSLCLEALGGMPGPYIKWFSHVDLPRVLEGYECKRAYAQSCVAFSVGPGSVPLVFTGRAHGVIVDAPRGAGGFGWDACFKPDGHDATFAEMDAATKNGISHRSRALEQLSNYLKGDADLLVALCAERVDEPQEPEDRFFFHRRRKEI